MSTENVTSVPVGLDHKAIAEGIGELKEGTGYSRVLVGGKTIAYLKKASVTVPAALVATAPKKLASFKVEKNGVWAGAQVDSEANARAIVEYVAQKAAQA